MRLFNSYLPELDATCLRKDLEFLAAQASRAALAALAAPAALTGGGAGRGRPADDLAAPREIGCPICGAKLRAPGGSAGRIGRCKGCDSTFPIPTGAISAMAI